MGCIPFRASLVYALIVAFPAIALAAEDDNGAIKYRQSVMKGVGGHTGAIYQIVKNDNSNKDHLKAHARALSELMDMIPGAFQRKTSGGKTRSKPEIWSDAAGFESATRDAREAADGFSAAAQSGSDAEVGEKLEVLLDTCKDCHKHYREKKE